MTKNNIRKAEIFGIIYKMFYQNPLEGGQYTFSPCMRCKTRSARNGRECLICLKDDLIELAGVKLAEDFIQSVNDTRSICDKIIMGL